MIKHTYSNNNKENMLMILKMKTIIGSILTILCVAKSLLPASLLLLLFLFVASCTDETERGERGNSDFRVTASIENDSTITRVADRNDRTSFTENDPIFIGWSESTSYKYLCSGTNGIFVPNSADTDRKLWSDLLKSTATTVDVYAWYGTMSSSLPAVGATISIPQDQTSEVKLLSAICMAAHQQVSPATNTLSFTFHHLTARLLLSVDIVDDAVTQPDVMDATAQITHIYADGTIATDASSNAYQLSLPNNDKAGTQTIRMKRSWSDQQIYHLDFECLLPPQTLGEKQSIIITLANGKEYVCKISGEIALQAGQKTTLSTVLKASEDATIKPKLTTIPYTANSAYSGNRLFCAIQDPTTEEFRYRVYDKQPDGSWGDGVLVYEDENGTTEFPTDKYKKALKYNNKVDICGEYAAIAANTNDGDNNCIYFVKKSKNTGVWYCSEGKLLGRGYSLCMSEYFLVNGNHGNDTSYPGRTYIYPIKEDGTLGNVQTPSGIGTYKSSLSGKILATNTGVYGYDDDKGSWGPLFSFPVGNPNLQRPATDGIRVIMQDGYDESEVYIYDLKGNEEEWETAKPKGGVGRPVAIYGNYALVGNNFKSEVNICYRNPNTGKWSIINPEGGFLEMMKHWDTSITLEALSGGDVSLKGPRAMIVENKQTFFVENIDKMVDDYLAKPY